MHDPPPPHKKFGENMKFLKIKTKSSQIYTGTCTHTNTHTAIQVGGTFTETALRIRNFFNPCGPLGEILLNGEYKCNTDVVLVSGTII
jgi:hypothetical protein